MSTSDETLPRTDEEIVEKVRERYARIARGETTSCCQPKGCCESTDATPSRKIGYEKQELDAVPEGSDMGLGCGAPIARLNLQPGETVLDLGSGGGRDAFLAADLVGESGKVIGVDMTPEMIRRAGDAARADGRTQVEFRQGRLENMPVDDASVDAVTSNCVINLVPDKGAVFREIARVLRPGGRLAISDILLQGELPAAVTDDLLAYVGCVAGAVDRRTYFQLLEDVGLGEITVVKDFDFLESALMWTE